MMAGNFGRDREPQADAARLARAVGVGAQETLADAFDQRRIGRLAVVGHAQANAVVAPSPLDDDAPR